MKIFFPFFAFCFLHMTLAFCGHDPETAQVFIQEDGSIAVCDGLEPETKYFEANQHSLPLVYWAIAHALSFDVPLEVLSLGDRDFLIPAHHSRVGHFLIDPRFIEKRRDPANRTIEYFFVKGKKEFKIFGHGYDEESAFQSAYIRAAIESGYVSIESDSDKLANLVVDTDGIHWTFKSQDPLTIGHIPTENLVVLASANEDNPIALRCINRNRQYPANNIYKTAQTLFQLTAQQKASLRLMEAQKQASGGMVYCLASNTHVTHKRRSLRLPHFCLFAGPNHVPQCAQNNPLLHHREDYIETDVRRVLWLSVFDHMPADTFSVIKLDNGVIVLPAISGQDAAQVIDKIMFMLSSYSEHFEIPSVVALPVNFDGRWYAFVVDRDAQSTKITCLNSLGIFNIESFLEIEGAIRRAFEGEVFTSPRVTTHHLVSQGHETQHGPVMVENLLRHVGYGGPQMPLVMQDEDLEELQQGRVELLRLQGQRLSREEDEGVNVRALGFRGSFTQ